MKHNFFKLLLNLWDVNDAVRLFFFLTKSKTRNSILVEVGTFTGYTALTIALALPSDGQLITCDITDQYVRQDLWKKAGVQDKITLKIGEATETLKTLLEENGPGSFDFIFIDADKKNYMNYYQLAIELVR